MSSQFPKFLHYWVDWKSKLDLPINRNGARLIFPPCLLEAGKDPGLFELTPVHPICIWNAPQKASATKHGSSHRQAIFINGSFLLRKDDAPPFLVKGACNVSIFDTTEIPGSQFTLCEIDAMHFDMETHDSPTPFHPTFHVQRGSSNTLPDDVIRNLIFQASHIKREDIRVERSATSGTPYLRLPTPQMDLFSVMTMVIADFFCNGGDRNPNVKTQFEAILSWLIHENNAAREGIVAGMIRKRAGIGGFTSSAHWYPECA